MDLGCVDMEEEVKKRFRMIYVPNWFTVDLKTGVRFFILLLYLCVGKLKYIKAPILLCQAY